MKGVVFTEFLELVEEKFGADLCDALLDSTELASGGSYTSVGSYDWRELVQLVGELSARTDVAVPDLIQAFGRHLFSRFVVSYPAFFEGIGDAFELLSNVEDCIHVEVKKLYSDAELPTFEYSSESENDLTILYRSKRPFADLAEGLIRACLEHYGDECDIQREAIDSDDDETRVRFQLTRVHQPTP